MRSLSSHKSDGFEIYEVHTIIIIYLFIYNNIDGQAQASESAPQSRRRRDPAPGRRRPPARESERRSRERIEKKKCSQTRRAAGPSRTSTSVLVLSARHCQDRFRDQRGRRRLGVSLTACGRRLELHGHGFRLLRGETSWQMIQLPPLTASGSEPGLAEQQLHRSYDC